ncbi:MAG: sulfite exporter TauE/SafE family protein [Aquificae bacterium]|nr:sulfite exporter TauE/SafE family protein [Aquificota bacterium]
MEILLPIAGVKVNIFVILSLGIFVGFLSGLLGIGGGIILNPALIKLGIPPIVTVGTSISQMVGATVSGFLAHLKLKNIDIKLGIYMVIAGFIGGGIGVYLTKVLEDAGMFREVLLSLYSFYLGFTGLTMLIDVIKGKREKKGSKLLKLLENLPFKVSFESGTISVFIPIGIGFIAGFLAAVMGVGGGFVIIPALIYLAGFPVHKAVGMSLFQMIFVTSFLTYFHATINFGVDIVLSLLLMFGSSFGAVFGAAFGQKIKKEYTKFILAVIVTSVALLSMYQLFFEKGNEKKVDTMVLLDNPIAKFAYENPSLYAILTIFVSIVFGTIISILTHRLKVLVEIKLERLRR